MNRQQRRSKKNSESLPTMKEWSPSMQKSENLEPKSPNSGHTHTQNSPIQHTNTGNTAEPTTPTTLTQQAAVHQNPLQATMNPKQAETLPPPVFTPTLEKLASTSSEDKPTKKKAPASAAPAPAKMSPRLTSLTKKYTELYATIGLFVTRANLYDGVLLIQQAENRATELINVAQHHPPMLKTLERLAESNDYITLGLGHGMMLYAILANHGRIKADPVFLAQLGYHPDQVMGGAAQQQESNNGSNAPQHAYVG